MASDLIMHAQTEFLATDGTNNYLYDQLWKLCAGPLFDPQKIGEELVTSINDELCQLKPVFNIPSKIRCNVFSIKRKVETTTDEIYAEISLLPDTSVKLNVKIQNIKCFTKVLSASDTSKKGGFVLNKRHAIECLPSLDTSHLTLSQEINAIDIHGHNGESRVGIRKAGHHQRENIPSSVISKESMHHGVVATALNAIKSKCMFVVFYKPRSSQFVVNIDKFIDGVNKKFSIGSRFLMKYNGMKLQQFQDLIRDLHRAFNTFIRHSKIRFKYVGSYIDPRPRSWTFKHTIFNELLIPYYHVKPNYNEQMVQAMKETSTTTATTSYRLFGVDLKIPAKTKDSIEPINSYKKFKISKIFEEEKVDHIQTRSHTKVRMEGVVERTVNLSIFDGYNQLIDELERLFDIKGKLHMHNQWKIVFINADGDMILLGDDPWLKFCNTAKEIFICSKNDAKIGDADNKFSEGHQEFERPSSVEVGPLVSSPPTEGVSSPPTEGVSSPWVSLLVSKKVSCDATITPTRVPPNESQIGVDSSGGNWDSFSAYLGGPFRSISDENLEEAKEEFRDILFARFHGEAPDIGRNIDIFNVIWSRPDKELEETSYEAAIYSDKIAEGGYISSASEAIGVKIGHFEISGQDYVRSIKENPLNSKGRKC
ncbi:hypothetical protein Bca4012_006548 [Brassica carinata]|uniref:(rape) hypothetical protein n=1 Tax=Brassica napus TaxID=3708 RepID=A0A078GG88_BRANA|nr:unnamed protein product [Brassica napus]CDY24162.1 BnaC03g57150D [Brassica napus]